MVSLHIIEPACHQVTRCDQDLLLEGFLCGRPAASATARLEAALFRPRPDQAVVAPARR